MLASAADMLAADVLAAAAAYNSNQHNSILSTPYISNVKNRLKVYALNSVRFGSTVAQ